MPKSKNKFNLKIIILGVIGVIVLLVIVGLVTGALKFNFTISRNDQVSNKAEIIKRENVSFTLPAKWSLREQELPGFLATLMSYKESDQDQFIENMNFRKVDLSSQTNMDLNQLGNVWLSETKAEYPSGDFNLLSREQVTVAQMPAEEFTYTVLHQGMMGKGKSVVMLKDQMAYVINFVAEESHYDNFISDVEMILGSVVIE